MYYFDPQDALFIDYPSAIAVLLQLGAASIGSVGSYLPLWGADWIAQDLSLPDVNWHGFGIIKGGKNPDAVWKFIEWLSQDARWSAFIVKVPAASKWQLPNLKEIFKQFKVPRLDAITNGLAVARPQGNLFRVTNPAVSARISEAINNQLFTGQSEPSTVLRALKPVLQTLLNQ